MGSRAAAPGGIIPRHACYSPPAINFLIDGGVRLAAYVLAGFLGRETLGWVAAALPLVASGLYVGGRIHVGLSQQGFVRLVSLILVASGTALLVRG